MNFPRYTPLILRCTAVSSDSNSFFGALHKVFDPIFTSVVPIKATIPFPEISSKDYISILSKLELVFKKLTTPLDKGWVDELLTVRTQFL